MCVTKQRRKQSHRERERERKKTLIKDHDFDDFFRKSSSGNSANPHKIGVSGMGSTTPMGVPKESLTPGQSSALPALADFESYPSLMAG